MSRCVGIMCIDAVCMIIWVGLLCMSNTCRCQTCTRDFCKETCKETCIHKKRPVYIKRDLYTYKRDLYIDMSDNGACVGFVCFSRCVCPACMFSWVDFLRMSIV